MNYDKLRKILGYAVQIRINVMQTCLTSLIWLQWRHVKTINEEELNLLDLTELCFCCFTEEFVLEESPKWKLLADVLEEIERDDAKTEEKRNNISVLFGFLKPPFVFVFLMEH